MKQTKLFLLVAVLIAAFSSCKDSAQDLSNVIPADAITVIHIDTKSLLKKADYKPMENKVIKKFFEEQKKSASERTQKEVGILENFLKNPNSIGVDLIDDCMMYIGARTMGVIWKMNDSKKLKETLTKDFSVPEQLLTEEDGITCVDLDGRGVACWTNEKLLVMTYSNLDNMYRYNSDDRPNLVALAKKQIVQDASESINSNKAFVEFISNKKDISLFYAYDNISGMWDQIMARSIGRMDGTSKLFDQIKEYTKGLSAGLFVSFEKGEVVAYNQIYYGSPETEKKFKELSDKMTGDITGEQLKYITEKPLLLGATNLKGEGVYDYLAELGFMSYIEDNAGRELAELGIDLKSLISNFNGDITFALNNMKTITRKSYYSSYEYTDQYPEFTLFADMKDAGAVWNLLKGKLTEFDRDSSFVEITPNSYSIKMDDEVTGYIGINNNMFYFTNSKDVYANLSKDGLKNEYASKAKGKRMFVYGNINPLSAAIISEMGSNSDYEQREFVSKGLGLLGDYSYATEANLKGEGRLVITDDSANSLAVICKFIDSIVTYAVEENM